MCLCLISLPVGCPQPASSPDYKEGLEPTGSEPPTLTILRPDEDISISRGAGIVIEWIDTDRDSNAQISFSLASVENPDDTIPLVSGISEDSDVDRFTISTELLPFGSYNLRGTIDDGINAPVTALAINRTAGLGEVVIRIVQPGGTSISNLPPQVFVRDPAFNLSVSQDDVVNIAVQPTSRDPNLDPTVGPIIDVPYDVDSTATLYIVLDLDNDPLNDDVVAPDPNEIIRLVGPEDINQGDPTRRDFPITVDVEQIPPRPGGEPYFIRATITDGQNPPVHSYAEGTLNVVRAVSTDLGEFVDLGLVGKLSAGARVVGFNPGSNLGTRMVNIRDFDLDGIDDFCLVARFGNPRNFGNIGEAYVIYGLQGQRFGGTINVNSTAKSIPGFILEAPPPRGPENWRSCGPGLIRVNEPRTEGITDVSIIPDLDGDNRPELVFGLPHVDGYFTTRDDDPGDDAPDQEETLEVAITLVAGRDESEIVIEAEPEDEIINFTYLGNEDTVIFSGAPNANFRSSPIQWVNGPAGQKWGLIKFADILDTFPPEDRPESIEGIDGSITLTVLEEGGQGSVHELFTDFDEATETFASFGEPVAGEDYDEEELASINAENSGNTVNIDVSDILQRLLFGLVPGNEIRLIIVAGDPEQDEDAENEASVASKEFRDVRQRPTFEITYDRVLAGGPVGCYPDPFANNFADQEDGDAGCNERKLDAGGSVSLLSSTNRDAAGPVDANRLADTVVSLELVGMRPTRSLGFNIAAGAQAVGNEDDRIAGARFQASGGYDFFDHLNLQQPPLEGLFGMSVGWMPDVNLDGLPELVISAPENELDHARFDQIPSSTHWWARQAGGHLGSITVVPGRNYDVDSFRDKTGAGTGTTIIPWPDDQNENPNCTNPGDCGVPGTPRCGFNHIDGTWEIFAEDIEDRLGGARSPGDFNLDSIPDLMCGAPLNDASETVQDTGAVYIIYGRSPVGDIHLASADDPLTRPPMLRIRGEKPGDQVGWKQEPVADVDGDGIDDVLFSAPAADFIVPPPECVDPEFEGALDPTFLNSCAAQREVFLDDVCKNFDYNNDRIVDDADRDVFFCLVGGGNQRECCPTDNGYVGVIFGGVNRQGDRVISQVGTNELGGVIFYGTSAGDRAGYDISSAGDFDKDGFGDILISAPGEFRVDSNGRLRMGVVYLVYGGPHLENQETPIELSEIGDRVPGLIFLSPYEAGAPDEAPTEYVGFIGDINGDGFGDIAIGASKADLLDEDFPQGDGSPNETGRRIDQGDIYIIYGNNVGRS
jgi:hypothetical protein